MNNKLFGFVTMLLFGFLGAAAFIGAFWNPWQIVIGVMCVVMFLTGMDEYRKKQ